MCQFLLMRDIDFPSTNDLLVVRKSIRLESKAVLNNKGCSVDYNTLVSMTANSNVSVVQEEDQDFIPNKLTLFLKDGGDGAGSMPKLKSLLYLAIIHTKPSFFYFSKGI